MSYWTEHYVVDTNPVEVASAIRLTPFSSRGERSALLTLAHRAGRPNILVSQGSGGHPNFFAEPAYHLPSHPRAAAKLISEWFDETLAVVEGGTAVASRCCE